MEKVEEEGDETVDMAGVVLVLRMFGVALFHWLIWRGTYCARACDVT